MSMAISSVEGLAFRSYLASRRPLFCSFINKARKSSSVAVVESLDEHVSQVREQSQLRSTSGGKDVAAGGGKAPEWKKLSSKDLGIRNSLIGRPTRFVLKGLRERGYDVYLVGGCVRDLILKRTPKDFDIITTAELKEVLKAFPRCEVVGKRFPICHVHIDDTIVEVSSFSTSGRKSGRNLGYYYQEPLHCDADDFMRWQNSLRRDFTINALMLDPFSKVVYDYLGGLEDIRKAKVCMFEA